ncbi:OmpW/AlkL family protein [Methylocella tundrae]|nr:OmpW family outer membrane protein [Methylocella tundrae]WPP03440.1 OmpW family outer membrane protein [Methylocella tundrae]
MAALMLGASAVAAFAADLPIAPAPALTPAPALPEAFQPFQVRLRAVGVLPEGGGILQNNATGGFVSGGVKASDAVIPELDVSYFFTKNIAIEAVCCVSYHNLFLKGGTLNGSYIGHTLLFPPTVLLQYHVTTLGAFQPYAGVGVNYTHFFSVHPDGQILNSLSLGDSWGVAGQIGFDYMIDDHWGLNFDVKKLLMNTRVNATVAPGIASVSGNAAISPWLIGAGITYRFGGPASAIVAKY